MIKTHKIRLIPTKEQKVNLFRAFAASRDAWNFGKDILNTEYHIDRVSYRESGENYKLTSPKAIKKIYNRVKPNWVMGTGTATQEAFGDMELAIKRYWDIRTGKIKQPTNGDSPYRKDGFRHGWLRWRSKGKEESFRQTYVSLKFDDKKVRYNVKVGFIKMSESLRFEGEPKSAIFSFDGIHFWVSVAIDTKDNHISVPDKQGDFIGVDVGIKSLAVTSQHNKPFENPKPTRQYEKRFARLQRKLDRQRRANNPNNYDEKGQIAKTGKRLKWKKPTKNMGKTARAIKKMSIKIANIRTNAQHQLTSELAKGWEHIGIEDLNVRGMLKNPKLAKHIADVGFSEIRRQFEYKADWYESDVVLVDRFFPSSKLCSGCNSKNDKLTLADRFWLCDSCGQFNDRDKNAAKNLENEARRIVDNGS
jgi:putative transposase